MSILTRTTIRCFFSMLFTACLLFSALSTSIISAFADTAIFEGSVSANVHVTETSSIHISNINLVGLTNGSKVIYNAPVYESDSVDGFSQSITWMEISIDAYPAPTSFSDLRDNYGNPYRQYVWELNKNSGTTLDATITKTFDAVLTGDLNPVSYTDTFPLTVALHDSVMQYVQSTDMVQSDDPVIMSKARELTSGSSTEVEAVENIMDFVRTCIPDQSEETPKDAVSSLHSSSGNCVNRAHLALALLRSAGIPARYVSGVVYSDPILMSYNVPVGIAKVEYTWEEGPHAWIEVYYPQEDAWVPYDPLFSKGFVDHRHLKSGIRMDGNGSNAATYGRSNQLSIQKVNRDISVQPLESGFTITRKENDIVDLQFIAVKQSPSEYFMAARDLLSSSGDIPGISMSISPQTAMVNSTVSLTASLNPARSDGSVVIKSSLDGYDWTDLSAGVPSDGKYTCSYSPGSPGKVYFKAVWNSGKNGDMCESPVMVLSVVNSTATVTPNTQNPDNSTGIASIYKGTNGSVSNRSSLILPGTGDNVSSYIVSGLIRDAGTGSHIAGATVLLDYGLVQADDDGRFTLNAPDGIYNVTVKAQGYKPQDGIIRVNGSDMDFFMDLVKDELATIPTPPPGSPGFGVALALAGMVVAICWRSKAGL